MGGWRQRAWPGDECPGWRPRPPEGGVGSGSVAAGLGEGEAGSRAAIPNLAGTGPWGWGCEVLPPERPDKCSRTLGGECASIAPDRVCGSPLWREAGGRGPGEPPGRAVRARDLWEGGVADCAAGHPPDLVVLGWEGWFGGG